MADLTALLQPGKMTRHETPDALFAVLSAEFGPFDMDACADINNHKLPLYYDEAQDGLSQEWSGSLWCNPPYGRLIVPWITKARKEAESGNATTTMLLPSRTDTQWWHREILPYAREICFLQGRVKFVGSEHGAPFPSVVVVFAPGRHKDRQIEVTHMEIPKGRYYK